MFESKRRKEEEKKIRRRRRRKRSYSVIYSFSWLGSNNWHERSFTWQEKCSTIAIGNSVSLVINKSKKQKLTFFSVQLCYSSYTTNCSRYKLHYYYSKYQQLAHEKKREEKEISNSCGKNHYINGPIVEYSCIHKEKNEELKVATSSLFYSSWAKHPHHLYVHQINK